MDTRTQAGSTTGSQGHQVDVKAKIEEIRRFMPETYKAIQDRAKVSGNNVYAYVRRGLRGEADCFYAIEGGRVVGTPFAVSDVDAMLARYMVQFGCQHLVMWSPVLVAAGGAGAAKPAGGV
jgi:hypothetical protein